MSNLKHFRAARVIAMALAVVLLAGLLPFTALAADASNVKQYNYYVCIGDSIAAGYGSYGRDVRGFVTVPAAYHSHVANATGAGFQSLAHTGMRTVEVRWLLDDAYSASDEAKNLRAMYFNGLHDYLYWMAGRTGPDDPGDPKYADPDSEYYIRPASRAALMDYYGEYGMKYFFRDNIKKADLVTVALGLNDIFLYAMKQTARELDNLNLITEVTEFIRYMNVGMNAFRTNWAPLINAIKALNPDTTIVVVGMYNPFGKVKAFSKDELVPIGKAADVMVAQLNTYMKQQASTLGYKYADVTKTEIDDTVPFADETFFDEIVKDCHPTEAGHKYIADQILAQLPARDSGDPTPVPPPDDGFPFTDVAKSDWFYDDVHYCWENGIMNGMSPTQFEPQGTTTRAQFATVLYRLAKSPDVTGMTCPFTDLQAGSWYENAVVWGWKNGVINGTSPTTFSPDEKVTREQMVTMLYRYAGSPAANGSLSAFSDAGRVSDYAKNAMIWAVDKGIIGGMGDGTLYPQGYATRAQLAKILHKYQTMS